MINIKSSVEIDKMRVAGKLTAQVLSAVGEYVKAGVSTLELDAFCEDYIRNTLHAIPGSKGQDGYTYSINTSLNHVVCHGMPSATQFLKNGDILNIDITVIYEGYYGDSSKMFCVGAVAPHAKRLVDITQECMYSGISVVKPGATLGDIGHAIQSHALKNNYSVVKEYCGHGIGLNMHEEPQVLHFGKPNSGLVLQEGMTFTIEPMINQGKSDIKHLKKDGWDIAVTKDHKLSAQWEHTIVVTQNGHEILTLREEEKF